MKQFPIYAIALSTILFCYLGCDKNPIVENNFNEIWELKNSNSLYSLTDIYFIDDKIGFAVGSVGVILKTTDGGERWDIIDSVDTPSPTLRKINFFNKSIGLIVGNNGIIKRTTDGGNSWITTELQPQNSINDICIINEQVGFIIMGNLIYKTTNSGIEWKEIYSYPDPYKTFSDIHFSSVNVGYGLVKQAPLRFFGAVIKTTNSGDSWIELDTTFSNPLYSCYFINDDIGFITDLEGRCFKTLNGGESWFLPSENNLGGVTFLYFVSPNIGYGYKLDGKLIKTYNGAENWDTIISENTESLNSFYYNKTSNSLFVVGNQGKIYKCSNPKL